MTKKPTKPEIGKETPEKQKIKPEPKPEPKPVKNRTRKHKKIKNTKNINPELAEHQQTIKKGLKGAYETEKEKNENVIKNASQLLISEEYIRQPGRPKTLDSAERINIIVERETYKELQDMANNCNVSTSEIIRDSISLFLGETDPLIYRDIKQTENENLRLKRALVEQQPKKNPFDLWIQQHEIEICKLLGEKPAAATVINLYKATNDILPDTKIIDKLIKYANYILEGN